jgi:hypothetical protein
MNENTFNSLKSTHEQLFNRSIKKLMNENTFLMCISTHEQLFISQLKK